MLKIDDAIEIQARILKITKSEKEAVIEACSEARSILDVPVIAFRVVKELRKASKVRNSIELSRVKKRQ